MVQRLHFVQLLSSTYLEQQRHEVVVMSLPRHNGFTVWLDHAAQRIAHVVQFSIDCASLYLVAELDELSLRLKNTNIIKPMMMMYFE